MQVRLADFVTDYAALRAVRFAVFVDEQRVPEDEELDDRDPECLHVLALDGDAAVGTGRLDLAAGGKIGRVAVTASHRGRGVGAALMRRLHVLAAEHGLTQVWCNAQVSAIPFYERLGYRVAGPERFFEAGIEHVKMEADLNDHD
jgi:predicted GNAT family N-acyltransferase